MHVFHYASYEPAAMKRLMGIHATREDEVDRLLTVRAFVDLFTVVRQGVRVSQPSYSIKKLEPFYMDARDAVIAGGGESVVHYERWIDTQDPSLLHDIERYNELDCVSTRKLRDWLLRLRGESIARFGEPPPLPPETARVLSDKARAEEAEREAVTEQLLAGVPDDVEARSPEEQARWLLAQLLDYHRREAKPAWWAFFDRMSRTPEELMDDPDCIGGLKWNNAGPLPDKKSLLYTLAFPPQETKLGPGEVVDATTGRSAGRVITLDPVEGILQLRRGPSLADVPLPASLGPGGPYDTSVQRAAVFRVARSVTTSTGEYRALRDLLLAAPPRIDGLQHGTRLSNEGDEAVERLSALSRGLDDSVLFVQGPPGAGKTYTAARAILALLRAHKRVGVAANSHKAIHKLLAEVETCAESEGFSFCGVKKSSDDQGSVFAGRCTESVGEAKKIAARLDDIDLVAGTAWLFAREEVDQAFDYLFVDEAGQMSLADMVAIGTSARNLVLIGDPAQLAQPAQGFHPPGAGVSALDHLLGDATTIPPEHGFFLATTWRMHPDVSRFISEVMYENRLEPDPANALQEVIGVGTGLRFIPVDHDGNRQASPEEAVAVATAIKALVGNTWRDKYGEERMLKAGEVLVVAPYNAHVRTLRDIVPPDVQVGTVDKFQGQEAPVVFFSMATSSGDELPRTLEFLFSRNRLNVAISRARCLAVLVASPRLLRVNCKTVEQTRMVNALCRFVEMATVFR